METVNKTVGVVDVIKFEKQYDNALGHSEASKERLSDAFVAWVGHKPTYKAYNECMAEWSDKVQEAEPELKASSLRSRWSRMVKLAKEFHDFEIPKSDNPDAKRKQLSKGEFASLNADDLEGAFDEALKAKDFKKCASIQAEVEKRAKMLERADKQKDKVYLKDLAERVKGLDMTTARIVAWVLVEKNLQQVKALIK